MISYLGGADVRGDACGGADVLDVRGADALDVRGADDRGDVLDDHGDFLPALGFHCFDVSVSYHYFHCVVANDAARFLVVHDDVGCHAHLCCGAPRGLASYLGLAGFLVLHFDVHGDLASFLADGGPAIDYVFHFDANFLVLRADAHEIVSFFVLAGAGDALVDLALHFCVHGGHCYALAVGRGDVLAVLVDPVAEPELAVELLELAFHYDGHDVFHDCDDEHDH